MGSMGMPTDSGREEENLIKQHLSLYVPIEIIKVGHFGKITTYTVGIWWHFPSVRYYIKSFSTIVVVYLT